MADLNVSATGVVAANSNTNKAYGIAGEAVSAGQVVYLDPTSNLIHPAQGTALVQAQNVVGVALDSTAGSGQPLSYATAGDVTLPTSGAGSIVVGGSVYVLSTATAGGIAPSTDPAAGTATFITVLGLATNPANLRLNIIALGAPR